MKRSLLFAGAFALIFSVRVASAHPFLNSIDSDVLNGPPQQGTQEIAGQGKILAKLVKRALWRQKVAEALKGRVSTCTEQFSETFKSKLGEMVQKVKDKAQEQGITIGDFVPEGQTEVSHETSVQQRQQAFLDKLQTLRGLALEKAFLQWVIKDSDRLVKLHEAVKERLQGTLREGLKSTIEENQAAVKELKQAAQKMLGEQN